MIRHKAGRNSKVLGQTTAVTGILSSNDVSAAKNFNSTMTDIAKIAYGGRNNIQRRLACLLIGHVSGLQQSLQNSRA
jgi:hypothetical protein